MRISKLLFLSGFSAIALLGYSALWWEWVMKGLRYRTVSQVFEGVRSTLMLAMQLLVAVIMTSLGGVLVWGGRPEGLIPLGLGVFAFYSFGRSIWSYLTW